MQALHRWMADDMAAIGAHIDAFEYCPDHPDGTVERYRRVSDRRKPAPGMITDLLGRFRVDADASILIGDKASDLEAAHAAGLKGHLFSGGNLEAFRASSTCRGGPATSPARPEAAHRSLPTHLRFPSTGSVARTRLLCYSAIALRRLE